MKAEASLQGRRRLRILIFISIIILISLYLAGVLTWMFEEDFDHYYYPLVVDNIRNVIEKIEKNLSGSQLIDHDSVLNALSNSTNIVPLTQFEGLEYSLDINPSCEQKWGSLLSKPTSLSIAANNQERLITIVIIVKSAVNNYARRDAIRNSWYLDQVKDLFTFRTVFIVGKCHEKNSVPSSISRINPNGSWKFSDCEEKIAHESMKYGDIIQSTGIDSYYNNTIKTYMTLRWLNERCLSDFVVAIDDDYVFEVDNLIKFMHQQSNPDKKLKDSVALLEYSKTYVWAGYVRYTRPMRSVLNKWYISREDYAYNEYPPFITGGLVVYSQKTVKHLYYTTFFTRSFKFDDVYLGILGYKLGLQAYHSDYFQCILDSYLESKPARSNSTDCIGVHDIEPNELVQLWQSRAD